MSSIKQMQLEDMRQLYLDLLIENLSKIPKDNNFMAMVIGAFINRAIALNRGFISLQRDDNYLAALPLIRMQIDNCIRLYAFYCFGDRDSYIRWAISGEPLGKQHDSFTNERLTDINIIEKIDKLFPKVKNLYRKYSGFVHFSEEIIKYTSQSQEGSRIISVRVGDYDEFTREAKESIFEEMKFVNTILYNICRGLIHKLIDVQFND